MVPNECCALRAKKNCIIADIFVRSTNSIADGGPESGGLQQQQKSFFPFALSFSHYTKRTTKNNRSLWGEASAVCTVYFLPHGCLKFVGMHEFFHTENSFSFRWCPTNDIFVRSTNSIHKFIVHSRRGTGLRAKK
jgi:hypothetical protein